MKVAFNQTRLSRALQERLHRQNPGRLQISSAGVSTKVKGTDQQLTFRMFSTTSPYIPGQHIRIAAYQPNEALPLFPIQVGFFDYRIVDSTLSAMSGTRHDRADRREALLVHRPIRKDVRGIGSSLLGIALNHLAAEKIGSLFLHNVMAPDFFFTASRSTKILDVYHEDIGPTKFSEVDPADEDVVINMAIATRPEKYIPRIQLSLRGNRLAA